MPTLVHFAPHPDDELIGCPASLMALRDGGWKIVNVACGLGRPDERDRRRHELEVACARAGFELHVPDGLPGIGSRDDLHRAEGQLVQTARSLIDRFDAAIVCSPSLHDRHPGHEVVARAVRRACERGSTARWWMWGLWGDLALPSLLCEFDRDRLEEICFALEAHAGELHRNDYRRLVEGRAAANSVLGAERAFGFKDAPSHDAELVELVCEALWHDGVWRRAQPRWLSADRALEAVAGGRIDWWLDMPSVTTLSAER